MESHMVKQGPQNDPWSRSLNSLVKKYITANFPHFTVLDETDHGPFWGVRFAKDYIQVLIGGDVGFHVEVWIDGKSFPLWQYDKSVNNAVETNESNVLFQLNVLKRFLTETSE